MTTNSMKSGGAYDKANRQNNIEQHGGCADSKRACLCCGGNIPVVFYCGALCNRRGAAWAWHLVYRVPSGKGVM